MQNRVFRGDGTELDPNTMKPINQDIEEILETLSAESFIFGNYAFKKGTGVPLPDDNHELPPLEKAKAALAQRETELLKYLSDYYGLPEKEVLKVAGGWRKK